MGSEVSKRFVCAISFHFVTLSKYMDINMGKSLAYPLQTLIRLS